MLLTMEDWNRIRGQFSKEEKDRLNAAIAGEVLCPRGCIVDEAKLGVELLDKVTLAVKENSKR